uniref:Cilia- and flagella-associated protein 53 n=1 Tax=Monopterus albus TaxID=43700 RepID=A0A3Q3JGJ6_MONAL
MLLSRRSRGQEVTGPTPHSVARAKLPLSRPADHLTLERQKQDATRDEVLEFTRYQQTCDIKNSWLQSSERHFLRRADQRHVLAAVRQHESGVEERKDRFPLCLFLFQAQRETKKAKMREKPKALRGRRESERQQLVSDKLEQLFREQCEELRTVESRRCEQQVSVERAAQVRSQRERRQLQRQEDQLFDELWEADRRAKEEQEDHRAQMEATELQRVEEKELREEEARLTLQQQEVQRLQKQREQLHKLQTQQATRRQLDRGFRLKMQRLAREQQEELQLDMSILQQLLQQETDQRQEAAQRKLREEQQRYRQYLSEELQKQRREEEETEQLMEEKLKETWTKREEQSRLQREARNQLMNEVMELNMQKRAELAREREELNRLVEESRVKDEEEKRRRTCEAYQADLRAQIRHRQQLRSEDRAQAQREIQQGLILQQLYDQKKDEILSRPTSHTVAPHPFRRAQGSRSAPQHRLT